MEENVQAKEIIEVVRYAPDIRDYDDWNDCKVQAQIRRFREGESEPYDISRWGYETLSIGLLTDAGGLDLVKALRGSAFTAYSNANARTAVGTSSTAAAYGNTSLTGEVRKAMDATFPLITGEGGGPAGNRSILFRSTYASGDANQAWNEFGIFNAGSGGTLLDRFVSAQGTKASGQVWELSVTLQFG